MAIGRNYLTTSNVEVAINFIYRLQKPDTLIHLTIYYSENFFMVAFNTVML